MKKYGLLTIFVFGFAAVYFSGMLESMAKAEGVKVKDAEKVDSKPVTEGDVAEVKKPTERFKFYDDVKSLDDLEEDVDEQLEDSNVKIVYKTPESCKEFTLYLDNKARKLDRKERRLKKREVALRRMTEEFEALTLKYTQAEARIKKVMQNDPSNLKENPELIRMVKLYETFSPEEAAARLKNLDLDLTIAILKGMKAKSLSRVMSAMEPKLSAALSSQMIRGF